MPTQIFYVELSAAALTAGRAFDGVACGTFTDMHGRSVTISPEDLPAYVANTKAAIAATKGESGELAGLPIDARDHDKGDGAGWIVDCEAAGEKLRFVPKWTELGLELVGKSIRRFFSATIDLANKVILGGTLTNWPATRAPNGRVLLRPIELSEGGLEEQIMAVRRAFYDAYSTPQEQPMVDEVFPDYVIVESGGKKWKAAYTIGAGGEVTFAPQGEWVEVVETYVEARAYKKPAVQEKETMAVNLADLSEADRASLAKQVATELVAHPSAELAAVISETVNAARAQVIAEFTAQRDLMARQTKVVELCQRLTNGTPEAPRALKNVDPAELGKRLLGLPADDAAYFSGVLEGVVRDGLIEFTERGHSKRLQGGKVELPAEYANALDTGKLKIADLSNSVLGLGDLAQYDLSRWAGKEK